jgi:GT2 family glycosyltransferase
MGTPTATVIVVSRDRWSLAPATLDYLLARTDPRHPVVVVEDRAPREVSAQIDRLATSGRVSVVRRNKLLAGNQARNLGVERARTEWVAFVENDVVMSDGWLEHLLAAGEARDAASAYPAYLEPWDGGPVIHGIGSNLVVGGPPGRGHLREQQIELGRPWREVAPGLRPAPRIQAEPHALLIRREVLDRIGGLDESLLSWFDHTDLALHHRRLDVESWFVPDATCTYFAPPPLARHDVPGFLLRWSRDWFDRSRDRMCTVWGLDPDDTEWDAHARYRARVRGKVLTRSRRVNEVIDRVTVPAERLVDRWNDRARP